MRILIVLLAALYFSSADVQKETALKREAEVSAAALEIEKLYSRGQAELYAGEPEKSVVTFRSALELAGKIGSREHELKCLRQLSFAYLAKRDLGNFLDVNEKSLQLARGLNDRREKVRSMVNLGSYYSNSGDYSRALSFFSDALDVSKEGLDERDQALCLKNIGLILSRLGLYERSADYLQEAHAIERQSGNVAVSPLNMINLGMAFRNRGLVLSKREDLYDALDYLAQALDSAKKDGDRQTELAALNNIGNIHLHLEKYHVARNHFRRALRIAEELPDGEARLQVLTNLGFCHLETGDVRTAQEYLRAALEQGSQIGKDKILWEPWFHLGRSQEKAGSVEPALDCYRKSIDAVEHIRNRIVFDYYKVGFMKNKFKVYEAAVDLLYLPGKDNLTSDKAEEIFEMVERAKARAFLETLGEEKGSLGGRLNPALERREKEIAGRISSILHEIAQRDLSPGRREELQKTLQRHEDEYLNLVSRIRAEGPDNANFVFPLPIRVAQVRERLLDDKTAILEYFVGEKYSLLFLLTKGKLDVFPLPPGREIAASTEAYLKLLSEPPREDWTGALAAGRLSRDLLSPALQILPPSIERLIFIPDGPLLYLPFDTLALHLSDQSPGEDFLISKYVVSYAPSCSSLLFLKGRQKKDRYARNLLAFGNPLPPSDFASVGKKKISVANILKETYEGRGFDFSSLPQSGREIKEISRFFSKDDRTVRLRGQASKVMVKSMALEDYRIIHFACHGFIDEKIPYRTALALSRDERTGEDGFLQVREIAQLRMAAVLVVLSACETAGGRVEKGEGILGLTRSFLYSGAGSAVSSLWKIGDKAAGVFMGRFYSHLSRENDIAQALRLAKLDLMKSGYSHPFYWAPFVLHGESGTRLDFR